MLTTEETPYGIFARESRLGIDEDFVLSKEELHDFSHNTEEGDAEHLT